MTVEQRKLGVPRPVILVLLALTLYISFDYRTSRIDYSPGWFRDEGTYLEIARHLSHAQIQLGAINVTFVGPYMTHPPVYFLLGSLYLKITRPDMYSFRMFNALLGVLATLLIFFLGHEAGRYKDESGESPSLYAEMLGLLAAFFFAIHKDAVTYNRMVFPYNLYLVEGILVAWFTLRYIRKRDFLWCLLACFVAAAALLTVYYAIVFLPFLFLAIFFMKKPRHFWALAIVPLPLLFFLGFMAFSGTPGFWDDINVLRKDAGTGPLFYTLYHYHDFFQTGLTYFIGMAGLFLIRRKSAGKYLFVLYFLMMHIVLRRYDTIIRFVHYPVIPLLPFVALGCAAFALFCWNSIYTSRPAFVLLLIPIALASYLSINQVKHGIWGNFYSPLEFCMTKKVQDTYDVALYMKHHIRPNDLVISNTQIWSLLPGRNAELSQALAYDGKKVDFYKQALPRERFLFSPALENAAFVIMDNLTDQWKLIPPDNPQAPLREAIFQVENNWILSFEKGEYRVYKNPNRPQQRS